MTNAPRSWRRIAGVPVRAGSGARHIAIQVIAPDQGGISDERLDLFPLHQRIGHPLIEVTHHLDLGHHRQLRDVCKCLWYVAIEVGEVRGVGARVCDEIAQPLLLSPGETRFPLSGGLVCVPSRRKRTSNGFEPCDNNAFGVSASVGLQVEEE